MSFLGWIFQKFAGAKAPSREEKFEHTVETMKKAIESIDESLAKLETQKAEAIAKARTANAKGKKAHAMALLRQRNSITARIASSHAKRLNFEQQINALESARDAKMQLNAMRAGSDALKGIANNEALEEAREAMEDIDESVSILGQINESLSAPLATSSSEETELEKELAELEADMKIEELAQLDINLTPLNSGDGKKSAGQGVEFVTQTEGEGERKCEGEGEMSDLEYFRTNSGTPAPREKSKGSKKRARSSIRATPRSSIVAMQDDSNASMLGKRSRLSSLPSESVSGKGFAVNDSEIDESPPKKRAVKASNGRVVPIAVCTA